MIKFNNINPQLFPKDLPLILHQPWESLKNHRISEKSSNELNKGDLQQLDKCCNENGRI